MYNLIKMPLTCLLIMTYTNFYYRTKKRMNTRTSKVFEVLVTAVTIHLVSAVITEYTVNNRDTVPEPFNNVWHIVFLVSLTCVLCLILDYLLLYVERASGRKQTTQKKILAAVCLIGVCAEIVLPCRYIDTVHGAYMSGMKAYALYAVVIYTMIMQIIIFSRYWEILGKDRSRVLFASLLLFAVMAGIQIFWPYLLLTDLAVTMFMLGIMVNTEDSHVYISYYTGLYNEIGCREILRETLLLKKPFSAGVYVFLEGKSDIAAAMLSVQKKIPEKKYRLICGTLADNVLIVLPVSSWTKGIASVNGLPEPEEVDHKLGYTSEIFQFTGKETVTEILDGIRDYKNRYEESALQRDELTGLLRRAAFIRQVEYMINNKKGFTFVMIDLDDFKSINDIYGHKIGDDVLKYVANTFVTVLRTSDAVCRIGGDEFAVALCGVTDSATVCEIAERVKKGLEEQTVLPDDRCAVRLSCGAKLWNPADGEPSFQELYTEADAALYKAKRGGKNRLFIAGSTAGEN